MHLTQASYYMLYTLFRAATNLNLIISLNLEYNNERTVLNDILLQNYIRENTFKK